MSQPGRYLHLLEPLAQPLTVRELDTWREQNAPPDADMTSDDRYGRRFTTRAGLIVVLAALVCSSGAWMAVTVQLIARI